ncbi:Terminase [Gluconacetobacter diazotrophicus PA1 5]|uniref:terminase large subunit n=1 Tax=Gluconacetobacter diazotrophicus TaxID=33996 RepID=UPI000173B3F6|nr:terminase TerL endonuclease subunit [Gluconacetobacter diazotrophicus]ACI50356.1 Terminase [Gluconacetobacter diazotrophicus PA1 5]
MKYEEIYNNLDPLSKQQYSYPYKVLNGTLGTEVCELTRLACERSFRDFELPDFYYDPTDPERFRFLTTKLVYLAGVGSVGGTHVQIEDWQLWYFSQLLGWKNANGRNKGKRRFRKGSLWVARGNNKTGAGAWFCLYMLLCDGEWDPQVYSVGVDRDQASHTFKAAANQIETNPKLFKALGAQVYSKFIKGIQNYKGENKLGVFKALARGASKMNGLNIHFAFLDELHAYPDRLTYDVIVSGAKKRDQSLVLAASTAGLNLDSFGYEDYCYARSVLRQEFDQQDEQFFSCVWEADEGDDPYSEATWEKANPCWNSAIDQLSFRAEAASAKRIPSKRREFFTKNLNQWLSSGTTWLDMDAVKACYDPDIEEDDDYDFGITGIDLGSRSDLCVYTNVFVNTIDEQLHYYVFPHPYTSEGFLEKNISSQFRAWQNDGWLTVHKGNAVSSISFQKDLLENYENLDILEYAFDRNQANYTMETCSEEGIEVISIGQNAETLSEATSEFEIAILENRIHFKNPMFLHHCANSHIFTTIDGYMKPIKESRNSNNKIDIVASTVNAIARCLWNQSNQVMAPGVIASIQILNKR